MREHWRPQPGGGKGELRRMVEIGPPGTVTDPNGAPFYRQERLMEPSCSDLGRVEHAGRGQARVWKPHNVEECFI